ncbi:MAG TPA: SIR2 family protein [Rhizomicrobium sp.]
MRFHSDGPEIPDHLLVARDEGQVVFFCGSGVSVAKAELPGFLGLAERVLQELHALPDSAPRELMNIATALQERKISGVGSILAADRLFGLLEREFAPRDIERAVGKVLRPKPNVDLSPHRTLLDLSQTPNGSIQLVTTNFDLLFENAAPHLPNWAPNDLPNLQHGGFNGIVHLHGMFDPQYEFPVGGNLVLSSAEFGRAYLAEGWATRFIQDTVEKFSLVFVGYTADDPPVQYLLEALNRHQRPQRHEMYAFQPGLQSEAAALWGHKGVTAIPYEMSNHDHSALWSALAVWAARARNPELWRKKVLRRAKDGPEALEAHERGQVMHLAMTPDGVKSIVTAKHVLPASWLLVFDPAERYETPGRRTFSSEDATFDSFNDYGLDSDPLPAPDTEDQLFRQREVPKGVLDALISNQFDPPCDNATGLHGPLAEGTIPLTPRLLALAGWIAQTADQPLAIWWALNKRSLHQRILRTIEHQLNHGHGNTTALTWKVWRYIFEASKPATLENIYALQARIGQEGWSPAVRRTLVEIITPHLKVGRPLASGPVKDIPKSRQFQLFNVSLEYKDEGCNIAIPDDQLASVVPLVRRVLENASAIEEETNPFTLNHIPPINSDPRLEGRAYERGMGFNRLVFWYIELFTRLRSVDHTDALREFDAWQLQNNTLFDRLRVWACGTLDFLPHTVATRALTDLSDSAFWTERGQRDLLLSLAARWAQLDAGARKTVQSRLLKGPPRFRHASPAQNRLWCAQTILERVGWLFKQGCAFDVPAEAALRRARRDAPDWKDEYAQRAADSHEGSSGFVRTDPTFDHIKDAPIRELLPRALAATGRDHGFLVERDPFSGLAQKRPIRVLRALLLETLPPEQNERAWAMFLQSTARRDDKHRLTDFIGLRLLNLSDAAFGGISRAILYWLEIQAKNLYEQHRLTAERLIDRSIGADVTSAAEPQGRARRQRDWLNSVLGSSGGRLIDILLRDPSLADCPVGGGLPKEWARRIGSCLALPGDDGLFALFQISRHVQWVFARDKAWTEQTILAALDVSDKWREVMLAGFLSNPQVFQRSLYDRLKPFILKLVTGDLPSANVDTRALGNFLLGGWLSIDDKERWLSDMEMRTTLVRGEQNFRTTTLWQVGQWKFEDKYYFLSEVWPLQLAARSETITDRLCAIAVEDKEHFAELMVAILPLLTKVRKGAVMFLAGKDLNPLFCAHPDIALEMFWRILPEESTDWPYRAHEGLETLYKADNKIRTHPHMTELTRRRRKGYF